MQVLKCFGDICPIPLLKAEKIAVTLAPGEDFMLVTDHSCVVESIGAHFSSRGYVLHIDEVLNGVWEITIGKAG